MALAQNNSVVAPVSEVVDSNLTSENTSMDFTVMDFTNNSNINSVVSFAEGAYVDMDQLETVSLSIVEALIEATGIDISDLDNQLITELEQTTANLTANLISEQQEEEEEVKVIAPRTILVTTTDSEGKTTTLFEGSSFLTKAELKAQYGDNIFVYYQQLYTTTTGEQTYDEAIVDEANFKKHCYTREEFVDAFTNSFSFFKYAYVTYSHKDLRKQQRAANTVVPVKTGAVKNNKVVDNKVDTIQPNFSLYLFTSMSQLPSSGIFPIKGLSDIQISTAKQVLQGEDHFINEYVLKEGEDESIKQQQECILFIVGTPAANDSYLKISNLRWITELETGEPVKGLIKNNLNPQTGIQVYLLRLNVRDKRQSDVFIQCGYNHFK